MTKEGALFGLRFDSDVELNPTPDELRVFLATTARAGERAVQGSDLARYHGLLEELLAYEAGPDAASQDVREKMFYAAIGHTQFANPGLELAVGQYKYHLHAFRSLDLRKPSGFIRTAEAELSKLNPKKKEDAEKRAHLLAMLDDRKRTLDALRRRRLALAEELGRIGRYVRNNLVRIENLCTASFVILNDLQVQQKEAEQMVEGIKERLKEKLRDSLHRGQISRQDLDAARRDAEVLAKEAACLVREDITSVTALLTAVHDHVKKHVSAIDSLMPELLKRDDGSAADSGSPFAGLEGVLVSLVSGYRFELRSPPLRSETAHADILEGMRQDLFKDIVALLEQDRRARNERRSSQDRRRRGEAHVQFTERRSGKDRRSGRSRRSQTGEQ